MTPDKLASIFQEHIDLLKVEAERLPDVAFDTNAGYLHHKAKLRHAAWMCQQGIEFVRAGKVEKAQRWLGFVQGVLWMANQRTINQMRDGNREA